MTVGESVVVGESVGESVDSGGCGFFFPSDCGRNNFSGCCCGCCCSGG